ncbi:TPA: metallophosphoesterase [Escherichia coli]
MPSTRYQKINAHHYRYIWAVGDIHGDYQLLQSRLHQLSFFPETDLLISVGDNIDRGPESLNVLRLLNQPWFTSVKGNHVWGSDQFWAEFVQPGRTWKPCVARGMVI